MTTSFSTRQEVIVSKNLVVPVYPSVSAVPIQTQGSIIFDKSTGALSVSSGQDWTNPVFPVATPTVAGAVYGQTSSSAAPPVSLGFQSSALGNTSVFVGYRCGFGVTAAANNCAAAGYQSLTGAGVGAACTALGSGACGNLTGTRDVGVGFNSLSGSSGNDNTAIGTSTCIGLVGSQNTVLGSLAATSATAMSNSVIIGYSAGTSSTGSSGNIVIGANAFPSMGSSTNNIVIGTASTLSSTTANNRIVLGANTTGTTDNEMTIAPTITQWRSLGLASAASANTLQFNPATGVITQAASSRRFKTNIEDLKLDSRRVQQLELKSFVYKYDGQKDYGLIAEEAHEILPEIVTYDKDAKPHGIKHLTLAMLLLAEVQRLRKEVEELKR